MAAKEQAEYDAIVIGIGFSGIGMAIELQKMGRKFIVLEEAADIGGTWYLNTYPGVACDIPSHLYSFSFEGNPDWTRMYSGGKEINAYLNKVVDKYELRQHVKLSTRVKRAYWDIERCRWHVLTEGGESPEKTPEGGVSGAEATDVLLAHGDRAAALPEVRSRLRTGQATVGTWAVLGRTLAGDPAHDAASRLLCRFPERARAVHDALRAAGARPVDPVELADWLGGEGRG